MLFFVSSVDTVAPALKPNNALTPLSLKISADAIPPANDLCICSAVVLKSNPVTDATLPVIFNISLKFFLHYLKQLLSFLMRFVFLLMKKVL